MQTEEVQSWRNGRQGVRRYRSKFKQKRYQSCELEGQRVRCYRSQWKLKRYDACELEGSECGFTEGNASSRGIKLTNWKAASAALQESIQADEV